MRVRNIRYFKRTKYNNKTCVCRQQHQHDSIKESNYCNQLEVLRKAKEIDSYEIQRTFELRVNNQKICSIRVDFFVYDNFGNQQVHEVKSYPTMTSTWNIKRKLFEALYPDMQYIVIK